MRFESQIKELLKLRKEEMDNNIRKENELLQIRKNKMEINIQKQ